MIRQPASRLAAVAFLLLACSPILSCVKGAGATSDTGQLVYTRSDLEEYADRWVRRDGAATFVISGYFTDFLMARPDLFLMVMRDRPEVFDSWLESLPSASFTAYGGCCGRECLECKRRASIEALGLTQVAPDLEPVRVRLRQRLEEIEVREVD